MNFQENLRFYRNNAGYSAKEFSQMLNIPYTTYTAYENQGREPKYKVLLKIADILQISIDDLFGRNIDNKLINELKFYLNINDEQPIDNPFNWIDIDIENINELSIKFSMLTYDDEIFFLEIDKKKLLSTISSIKSDSEFIQMEQFQRYIFHLFISAFLTKKDKEFLKDMGIKSSKKEKLTGKDKAYYTNLKKSRKQLKELNLKIGKYYQYNK